MEFPVEIVDLHKSYGNTKVLHGLNLSIAGKGIHGLVGLNGSGKTTTLECLLGLQSFDAGSISLLDLPPERLYQARGRIVGIFDTPSLHPALTVRQCLEHARLLCPRPTRSCTEVENLLGISQYSDYRVRHLSLGNKRRAAIAHGLLGNPELIILDEPFNGLDAEGISDVLALIARLNQELGTAFLLSSHQLPYLEQICTHLAVLHEGRILLNDATDTLLDERLKHLVIGCADPLAAKAVLEKERLATVERIEGKRLTCRLSAGHPAEINRVLVNNNLAVSELVQQRATLDSLFAEVTAKQGPDDARLPQS